MGSDTFTRNWTPGSLLRFVLPTIAMMLFMGLYTVVDTVFVARFVNADALSAINIVCPVINVTVGLGTMLATGGNAIISREMGAGRLRQAREDFTLLILTSAVLGLLLLLSGILWLDPLLTALGASDRLFPYCRAYLAPLLFFLPASLLQTLFSNLFVTAGKPGLGFGLSLLAGTANILLDYVFIVPCGMGVQGAALGTGCGYLIPACAGLIFFSRGNSPLFFVPPRFRWAFISESCLNGASEMVGQLSSALTTFLFNRAMLSLAGEEGVAAVTILIYSQFLLSTFFIGFSIGVAPLFAYHHGSGNAKQLKQLFTISAAFLTAASLVIFVLTRLSGSFLVGLFVRPPSPVYSLAAEGLSLFSYAFLFCGWNTFTSAFFTALSNGRASGILSFLRTFVFLAGGILLLPAALGLPGVWLASPIAEAAAFLLSLLCLICCRKRYFH